MYNRTKAILSITLSVLAANPSATEAAADLAPQVCRPDSSVDILLGIGGTPEGVISAAAMKCMGGTIQGKLWPRGEEERAKAVAQGYDLDAILFVEDLCKGDQVRAAPPIVAATQTRETTGNAES